MHRLFAALCLATVTAATLGPQQAGRLPAGPGRQYFYWLCPARTGDKAAPLLVWLNGGPGSSSMMGLFLENGPYYVANDGSLHTRNVSWNNNFDVLYVDQPAGTGFSTAQQGAYARNQDDVAEAFSAFLANFYGAYPDARKKQLWLTGESYAGKYLPSIAARFVTHGIPVAGVAIGNGLVFGGARWGVPNDEPNGSVYVFSPGSAICTDDGACVCIEGAAGALCDERPECGDGVVQDAEQCDDGDA